MERHTAYRLAAKRERAKGFQLEFNVDDVEDDEPSSKARK
jgi:hypothetical protein